MKTEELIKLARKCGERATDCETECPFHCCYDCAVELANELASRLQMALGDIPHNCGTCYHIGKGLRDLPCSICLTDSERKEWLWRGDEE